MKKASMENTFNAFSKTSAKSECCSTFIETLVVFFSKATSSISNSFFKLSFSSAYYTELEKFHLFYSGNIIIISIIY